MEFHVWGKLDENGKIQSVQSNCSHGNTFSFVPGQSPPPGTWISDTGDKYVPYSTTKELVYKLDTKIDEMALIMVQMGELTKRLHLQEKLIAEYEEKSDRQKAELKKLKLENDELRSMVFKRKRNSSSASGSIDDPSLTSPKVLDTPMECSIGTPGCLPRHEVLSSSGDGDDVEDINDGKTVGESDSESRSPISISAAEASRPLDVDENGYVPLWGESEMRMHGLATNRVHLKIDHKGYVQVPKENCDRESRSVDGGQSLPDWPDSGLDELDGFANVGTLNVELTVSEEAWCTDRPPGEAGTSEVGVAMSQARPISCCQNVAEEAAPVCRDKKKRNPDAHLQTASRYYEIPDELVLQWRSSPKGQGKGQGQGQGQDLSPDEDRYSTRPPMPLPTQRCGDRPAAAVSPRSRGTPHRNGLSKELKNCANGERRESEVFDNAPRISHRHSSPDVVDIGADERLSLLIKTMKTTMEWNEARRFLMSKSTSCTVEQAEESLRGIIKVAYYKCSAQVEGRGKPTVTIETQAQKLRTHLRRKSCYDEDILTKEFMEKCLHLMRDV